jgi:hypothetical protein
MQRLFLDHPRSIGETYPEHFRHAAGFGAVMLAAGIACLIHALAPFLFERTASRCITRLHDRMTSRNPRVSAEGSRTASA